MDENILNEIDSGMVLKCMENGNKVIIRLL
jgi:hypothetical protein